MRIALWWNDNLFAHALACLLETHGGFDVACRSDSAAKCLAALRDSDTTVLVVDRAACGSDEFRLVEGAKLIGNFGIVAIADDGNLETEGSSLNSVVSVDSSPAELVLAIRGVAAKHTGRALARKHRKSSRASALGLTSREQHVASLVAKGYGNQRIAEVTNLQVQSVKNLVSIIMRKLKCENRTQVALRLLEIDKASSVGT